MKFLSLYFLLLLGINLKSQTFNKQIDWFQNESFFLEEFIEKNEIREIKISKSVKKDGDYFQQEVSILSYSFNSSGQLMQSFKFIPLRAKMDTATFSYSYDSKQRFTKRTESQGPFRFSFYFKYENNFLQQEIKINEITADTSYKRAFETEIMGKDKTVRWLNSINKPFVIILEKESNQGLLISKRKEYVRTHNFENIDFFYSNEVLIEVKKVDSFNKKTKTQKYFYNNQQLDKIDFFDSGKKIKKMGINYNDDGLPTEIIERDMIEKTIVIYRLHYS